MKFSKKLISLILTISMVMTVVSIQVVSAVSTDVENVGGNSTEISVSANQYGLADNIQDGNILHCFNWKYNDIKSELKNIAEAGFTAVQTSPAQPAGGGAWYWLYQPYGFSIQTNQLGSKSDLQSLCTEAEKYGIKVVVDVVANHLSGDQGRIQSDLKPSQYWHDFNGGIDWNNRWQVTHGRIGMPDLATENSYVQTVVKNYIQELKSVGVDGIRFDAAKHIGLPSEGDDFWKTVTSDRSLWYYGEILGGPDDRGSGNEGLMKEYTDYVSVTDSNYCADLRNSFHNGNAPSSSGNWANRGISNDKLVYWAESHDNWSNNSDWGYSWHISQNNIDRAYAVAGSRDGVVALYYSRPSSNVKDNIMQGVKCSTHFTSPEVAAVNHFRNAMTGQKDSYTTGGGCSVVCREQGAVIVKGSGSGQVTVPNSGSTTRPGVYTDEITGNKWTVTSSTITGTIGESGIAVIYNQKVMPSNTISQAGGQFKADTLNLTLGLANATSGTYQIDGGEVKSYTGTTNITIGNGVAFGSTITVKLTATDGTETTSETYTFKKVDPTAVRVIAFGDNEVFLWNTANWQVQNCYSWPDNGSGSVDWPGSGMTYVDTFGGSKLYKFKIPASDGNVIFNDGQNQTDDLKVQSGLVVYDNSKNTWVDANTIDEDVVAQRGDAPITTPTTKPTTVPTTVTTTSTTVPETTIIQGKIGDVNGDGTIDIRDASLIQKYTVGLASVDARLADINGDGKVNVQDVTYIQKKIAGII